MNLNSYFQADPLTGTDIRVTVSVDGRPVVDTDLTTLYLRAKFGGGTKALQVRFLPFVPAEEDETPQPTAPVSGALMFRILEGP